MRVVDLFQGKTGFFRMLLMRLLSVFLLALVASCAGDGSGVRSVQGGGVSQGPYYNAGETVILTSGEAARVIPPNESVR